MLQMKFDYDWPAGHRDINVWKCERTDRRTDGQTLARVPSYKLIPSLRLWWGKNASENIVCWSCLLQIIALHYWLIKHRTKQCWPRPDCSLWAGADLGPHCLSCRLLKHFSRREKQTIFVAIGALRVKLTKCSQKPIWDLFTSVDSHEAA